MRILPVLLFFIVSQIAIGQDFSSLPIAFEYNDIELSQPLVGGLNNPIFSEVDFNNDGILDLYIYDAMGNVHLSFLNNGATSYTFTPEYTINFPEGGRWVLLRDFNNDGIADIFMHKIESNVSGIKVYKGFYENNKINFELFTHSEGTVEFLYFWNQELYTQWLYVSDLELPAIDDLDGDGDLDILSYGANNGYPSFYQNQSVEWGFGVDTLIFEVTSDCWGGFLETGNDSVLISSFSGECANMWKPQENDSYTSKTMHGGATFLTLDIDNDNDKDLLLGDITRTGLNLLTNGGSNDAAFIINQFPTFPSNDTAINVNYLPAAAHIDIDHDNLKDLLISPFVLQNENVENVDVCWYYKNMGDNNFVLQQKNLFTDEMLDLGSGSQPAFIDYNADGLLDLVVGTYGFYDENIIKDARLFLFENVGTLTEPSFKMIDNNWLNFSQHSPTFWFFAPTFGDIDNDGDQDLLVGTANGSMFFSENIGGANATLQFDNIEENYMNFNINYSLGQNSVPQLIDVNKDGKLDLIVGEKQGSLKYFENVGTLTNPFFEYNPMTLPNNNFWGTVDVRTDGTSQGFSAPVLLEVNGNFYLFVGADDGTIKHYTDISSDTFTLQNDKWGDIDVGKICRPAFADLNNDGYLEMIVGNFRGGLNAYQTTFNTTEPALSLSPITPPPSSIYPNPVVHTLHFPYLAQKITLFDITGTAIQTFNTTNSINLSAYPQGIYLFKIQSTDTTTPIIFKIYKQ